MPIMDGPYSRVRNNFYKNFHDEDSLNFNNNNNISPRTY